MNEKFTPILVVLLVLAAFLGGSLWMKSKYDTKQPQPSGQAAGQQVQKQQAPEFKASKSDNPEVKFFVMSFCPYGNQAEQGLKPVAELLGDQVSWEPVYIVADAKQSCEAGCQNSVYDEVRCQQLVANQQVPDMETCKKYFPYDNAQTCLEEKCADIKEGEFNSLHGKQELNQNVRELCAWETGDEEKWWNFVDLVNTNCSYQNADECWEEYAAQAGFNAENIKSCEANDSQRILNEQLALVEEYKVSGSPTVYINGVLYQGGRNPEDYKQAVCQSFNNPPEECNQTLSAGNQAAPAPGSCN